MTLPPDQIVERLEAYVSEQRAERIETVVKERTHTVVPVIEGLVNLGNVSAVMRSAEALGFYNIHIIENNSHFKNSERTSKGAEKWLIIDKWATPAECAAHLHSKNYNIIATHLDETAVPIHEIDFTRPTALVFGNEQDGVTQDLLEVADQRCIIPMVGFVESFNISVAAAVALYHAYRDRLARQGFQGDLTEQEKMTLKAEYYRRSVRRAEKILQTNE